jgi:hypothetical protein
MVVFVCVVAGGGVCMKSAIHHPNVPGWRLHLQRGMNRLFSSLTPERAWFRHTQDLGFAPRPRIPASFQPRPVEAFTGEPTRCYALATSSSTLSPAAQLPLDGVMPSPVVMRCDQGHSPSWCSVGAAAAPGHCTVCHVALRRPSQSCGSRWRTGVRASCASRSCSRRSSRRCDACLAPTASCKQPTN